MTQIQPPPKRRSIRLQRFDYRHPNAFFITLCARERQHLFGHITDGVLQPTALGFLAQQLWPTIGIHANHAVPEELVLMPNHLHAVLQITVAANSTTREAFGKAVPGSLPTLMKSFKSTVTREARRQGLTTGKSIWQRGYYEHVIRNEQDYLRILEYMADNPRRWEQDRFYTE